MPTYDGIGSSITHRVEVVGDSLFQDVDGGTLSTKVPVQIFSNYYASPGSVDSSRQLRFRVQPDGESNVSNSYVTDMGVKGADGSNYFFITAPQNTSNVGYQNTFVISTASNVGIGTTDPTKTLEVVGDIKCQTLSASTITGASPLVIQSDETIVINAPVNTGTMTVSNIFHSDQLTMSAHVVMGSDKTLTTSNIVANTGENLSLNSNLFVDTTTGNVGIGTTNPDKLLTLGFSINSSSSIQFQSDLNIIRQSEADRDAYFSSLENSIQRYADRQTRYSSGLSYGPTHQIIFGYSDDYYTDTGDTPNTYYPKYHEIQFNVNNSTSGGSLSRVMTLRGNGNVGIGTTGPWAGLHQYRSVSLTYVGNICGGVAFNSWNTGIINLSTTNRVIFMIIFTPDSGEYWSGIVTMSQVYPPNPDWNTFRNTTNASLYYRYDSCGNPYLGFRNGSTTQTPYMCAIVLH